MSCLFMVLVLVYATEPARFTWREVSSGTDAAAPGAAEAGTEACEPIVLDHAPVAFHTVAEFATEAVLSLNSYDYLTWDAELPAALNTYFTPRAARTYFEQFGRSDLLETVTSSYYTVSALSARPAMVVASGHEGDVRSWTVQVPVTLRYQTGVTRTGGGSTAHTQTQVFEVTVLEQRPSLQNYRGVAINDISNTSVPVLDDLDKLE